MSRLENQFLSVSLAGLLLLPAGSIVSAYAQAQRAGEVAARIPSGYIERAAGIQAAEVGTEVLWQDVVRTEPGGRVRVALEGGSILNLGSNTHLRMILHDSFTEQNELILSLGQMRARIVKLAQENAGFEVRTNTAVLRASRTDFWVWAEPSRTAVIVYEGAVRVSHINSAIGGAVQLFPGQRTIVPLAQPPQPPAPSSEAELQNSLDETSVGPDLPRPAAPRPGVSPRKKWPWVLAIVGGAATIGVVVAMRGGYKKQPTATPAPPGGGTPYP